VEKHSPLTLLALATLTLLLNLLIPSSALAEPTQVHVGVYLLNVGRIDTAGGTYPMDFYLTFRCDSDCDPSGFEIMNGKVTAEKLDDEPRRKVYRVRGELQANLNLRWYPFDRHTLVIELEDKLRDESRLVYVPDPDTTGVHHRAIVVGWTLGKLWKTTVSRDHYEVFHQTYSHATFTIGVDRPVINAFLKSIVPAIVIALTGFLVLLMALDKILQRLTLSASALVATVLFHLNMTSALPPIGYMTFADRFMLVNYIGLAVVLLVNVCLMRLTDSELHERAKWWNEKTRWTVPLLFGVVHAINVLTSMHSHS